MSAIRPVLKRRRHGFLIGVLAVTAGAAALAPVASSTAAPGGHDLVFRISGPAHQDVVGAGAIVFSARCPADACTIVASAKSASPSIASGKVRARIAAGGKERITVPLGARATAKLQAALEAGKSPTLTVRATARDAFGAKVPLELKVHPVKT